MSGCLAERRQTERHHIGYSPVPRSKTEERRLLDEIGDLSGRLDEAEAVAVEKEEAIESMTTQNAKATCTDNKEVV
ncbi:toxin-antitoxin system, antitoxin component, ArsR domain protein [Cooperia oncophora]